MVRFKKIRPRRGSLAVSIICGSPIAASNRSAELAYFIGSSRHDSRYSAIDMSVSLRASYVRTNALNRESLYMISLLVLSAVLLERDALTSIGAPRPIANQHRHIVLLDASRSCAALHNVGTRQSICRHFV